MKWALCVVGFLLGVEVDHLEIHCSGFAIFLSAFHHALAPCPCFTHWYWLKNAQRDIMVETSLLIRLPVKWYRNWGVVGDRLGIGIYYKSHKDTHHEW